MITCVYKTTICNYFVVCWCKYYFESCNSSNEKIGNAIFGNLELEERHSVFVKVHYSTQYPFT